MHIGAGILSSQCMNNLYCLLTVYRQFIGFIPGQRLNFPTDVFCKKIKMLYLIGVIRYSLTF